MKKIVFIIGLLLSMLSIAQAKDRVIELPPFVAWNSSSIEITKICINDTETRIYIHAFCHPNSWLKIATGTILKDENGDLYPIRRGFGIALDKQFWVSESGQAEFQLIFPPIPSNVNCIDFSEGDFEGAYKIWGIQLNKKAFNKFKLPQEVGTSTIDLKMMLPDPNLSYGKAILKGQILDYKTGMPDKGNLYFQDVIRNVGLDGEIRIQEDGTFYAEINVLTATPSTIIFPFGSINYILAPGETTSVVINLRESARSKSHFRRKQKPYGKEIYYEGYLADFQQELADHPVTFDLCQTNSYEDYPQQVTQWNGKTPQEYKDQILTSLSKYKEQIRKSKRSLAYKEFMYGDLELSAALKIIETERILKLAHIETNKLEGEDANKYYAETNIATPIGYYEELLNFAYVFSPKACYNSKYPILFDLMHRADVHDKILKALDSKQDFTLNLQAHMMGVSIKNLNPLTHKQEEEMAYMPPAYRQMILSMNTNLLQQIEANKRKTGFTVNEINDEANENLFPSIIEKYRGHAVLIDFWATWCAPCRSANKKIIPIKKDLKNKDIIYVYITGETSPIDTWKQMIPDIHGEHFRLSNKQWIYLRDNLKILGIPTYIILDQKGNITFRQTGFPGVETMKEELMKAINQ